MPVDTSTDRTLGVVAPVRQVSAATRLRAGRPDRPRAVAAALLVLTPVVLALGTGIGSVWISPAVVLQVVADHLPGLGGPAGTIEDQIVWQVRVPRVLLGFVVGAGLAVAGAVLQAVVRNPLADPYVLGVSAGACVGAVAVTTLGGLAVSNALPVMGVAGAAFTGALATLAVVVALGRRHGQVDPHRLLLAGVAMAYLLQAVTSYLQLRLGTGQLAAVLFWLLGTVSGASWPDLPVPAAVIALCLLWLVGRGRALNAMLLGDEAASSLGVDVRRLRLQLLVVASLMTAVSISVAGGVGFVGLVAPHCVRMLAGADHRRLLPLSALLGGTFLVLADVVGRVVTRPLELPLSIVTAMAGVPFFLVLLRRSSPGGQP